MAVGSSNGRSWTADALVVVSLDIYGRADAPGALDPVANDLIAVEKGQYKHESISSKASQSDPGGGAYLGFGFQSHRNTAVLWEYRRILAT
jgi:hypothetical protein